MAAILKMHMRTPTEVLQNARSFARVAQGEYSGEYVTRELASIYTCIAMYCLTTESVIYYHKGMLWKTTMASTMINYMIVINI